MYHLLNDSQSTGLDVLRCVPQMYIEGHYSKTWNKNRNLKSFVKRRTYIKLWAQASKGHIISWHINILKISYKVCDNKNNRYMKYFFKYFNISFKEYNIYGLKRMRIILKISTMLGSIDQIKNTLFNEYQVRRGAMASGENNDAFRASFQISPLEIHTETFLRHADVFDKPIKWFAWLW